MSNYRKLFTFTKSEVGTAFDQARAHSYGPGLKLLVSPTDNETGKILVVIPRTSGKAHDRNLIRRRVKAIFYEEKLYTTKAIWILLVRKQAIDLDFQALKQFLVRALSIHE